MCKRFTCLLSGVDFFHSHLDSSRPRSSSESLSSSSALSASSRSSSSSLPSSEHAECTSTHLDSNPNPTPTPNRAAAVAGLSTDEPSSAILYRVGSYWVQSQSQNDRDHDVHHHPLHSSSHIRFETKSPSSSCLYVDFRHSASIPRDFTSYFRIGLEGAIGLTRAARLCFGDFHHTISISDCGWNDDRFPYLASEFSVTHDEWTYSDTDYTEVDDQTFIRMLKPQTIFNDEVESWIEVSKQRQRVARRHIDEADSEQQGFN